MIKQKQIQERISVPHKHANKIIIRLPNYIGDSIMSTPAIQLLLREYPKAKLTILCRKQTEDILINHPSVNKIIIDYSKSSSNRLTYTLSLIRKIRKEKYDLGILFQNNFINALIFKLSRINTIIGYRNESRRMLLDYHIKLDRSQHYINRYAQLINNFLANKYTRLPQLQIWNKSGLQQALPVARPIRFVAVSAQIGKKTCTGYPPTSQAGQMIRLLLAVDQPKVQLF